MSECESCGAPITANRGGRFCMKPECRSAYERERPHRPERLNAPIPQEAGLPPIGAIVTRGSKIQCHECGRWLGALSGHVIVHGLTPAEYRERYGLTRNQSLASPRTQDRLREHALEQGIGAIGRANLSALTPTGRPKGAEARASERIGKSIAGKGSGSNFGLYPPGNHELRIGVDDGRPRPDIADAELGLVLSASYVV